MKRIILVFLIISILILAAALSIKPLILFLAKKQLSSVFIGSTVDIGGCELRPLRRIGLKDIHIGRQRLYDFKIKEAAFEYSPLTVIRGNIQKFSLNGAGIKVDLGQESILGSAKLLNLKSQANAFLINSLQLSGLDLDIKSPEVKLKARVSLQIDLIDQAADYFELSVASLEGSGLILKDAFIKAGKGPSPGLIRVGQIKYDKLAIKKIEGVTRLEDKSLFIDSLSAGILEGSVRGSASLELKPAGEYVVELRAQGVDLAAVVNDFNLGEKVNLSGKIGGSLSLKAKGSDIGLLGGDFQAEAPGGVLTIKDTAYLERMAGSSQSVDLLVESFKNYRYNTGVIKLSFREGNIILDVALDGDAGRRNLSVTLHDFKLVPLLSQ